MFSDFIPVVRQLTIKCRLCSIPAGCRCNGDATHTSRVALRPGTDQPAWTAKRSTGTARDPPTQSLLPSFFLHVGDVVLRRQDTTRTGVQVVKPVVEDLSMTQVFDSCDLLPGTL